MIVRKVEIEGDRLTVILDQNGIESRHSYQGRMATSFRVTSSGFVCIDISCEPRPSEAPARHLNESPSRD